MRYRDRRIQDTKRAHTAGTAIATPAKNAAGVDNANVTSIVLVKRSDSCCSPARRTNRRKELTITTVEVASENRNIVLYSYSLVRAIIGNKVDSMRNDVVLADCLTKHFVKVVITICTNIALGIIAIPTSP